MVRSFFCLAAAFAVFAGLPVMQADAQTARAMITSPVDEHQLVTLEGNTHPAAADPANDRGAVADTLPMQDMLLVLKRPAEREAALESYVESLTEPGSPNYHRWLTAAQIGTQYGPAQSDVAAVTKWLTAHGFTVNAVYPSRMAIDFSGSAGDIRTAFHTEIHKLNVNGQSHFANMRDPQIPRALAPAIVGIASLHDFHGQPASHRGPAWTDANCGLGKQSLIANCYFVTPPDLATIYNFNPVFSGKNTGQGETVTMVEDSDLYATSDWKKFRAMFGLSQFGTPSIAQTHPGGAKACDDPGTNVDDFEATLDTEYASAAAPGADIEVASCKSNATWGVTIAIENLLNRSKPPHILNVSYIWCESEAGSANNALYKNAYQQAAGEGVSIFVSAGDEGAAVCDYGKAKASHGIAANALASTAYDVAVGGTDFGDTYNGTNKTYWNSSSTKAYGSAKSYIPEIPWNNSCASRLIAKFVTGSNVTYGTKGFCNSKDGENNFITTLAGSGAPSSCATGSGGKCAGYKKPSWQKVFGNPSDGVRDLPDISMFAAGITWGHAYIVCLSDPNNDAGSPCADFPNRWEYGYGTSFAAPVMAGVQALIDHARGGKQGNPDPVIYKLARAEFGASGDAKCNSSLGNKVASTCVFHDVTVGDEDVPCAKGSPNCFRPSGTYGVLSKSGGSYKPAFVSAKGWDFATGLGSINVANFVKAWPH
ncbi:MAG TPA: S53 family peptidase [Rhizomicrobium sp.]|nr:S53 family peptidase [Rhizomicrobium sp.]